MDSSEIGDKTELKFKEWLEKHRIPYLYINQEKGTFSSVFEDQLKRPDFIILIENFGFILVDVKYKKISKEYGTYSIDYNETKKFSSFQRKFNIPIWYAISNEESDYKTWLWIPVSRVLELNVEACISSKSNEPFFPISMDNFIQISHNESIEKLFIKSL